jgi:hypothetical protein
MDAGASDEIEVILIRVTHPDLEAPILLSSDNADRISIEPLLYGTRSRWISGDGNPPDTFHFMLMSAVLPEDREDAPAAATIVLEVVSRAMAPLLRSTTERATVDMAVVLASAPDLVEQEVLGLTLLVAEGDAGEITLSCGREPIEEEPWPVDRMTRSQTPGLHA